MESGKQRGKEWGVMEQPQALTSPKKTDTKETQTKKKQKG